MNIPQLLTQPDIDAKLRGNLELFGEDYDDDFFEDAMDHIQEVLRPEIEAYRLQLIEAVAEDMRERRIEEQARLDVAAAR